jgi:hypothetical protein
MKNSKCGLFAFYAWVLLINRKRKDKNGRKNKEEIL